MVSHAANVHHQKQCIIKSVTQQIESMHPDIDSDDGAGDVFTVKHSCTSELHDIYDTAYDGDIPTEGIWRPTIIGMELTSEKQVQEAIWNPSKSQESIVQEWGFNFNDSPYNKREQNAGEQNDLLYNELSEPCVQGWAAHVKCKSGGIGKFSGKVHTHKLVAVTNKFKASKKVYDRDYKRITRAFYSMLSGECQCTLQKERDKCSRCSPGGIKVKLMTDSGYFINAARYILGTFQ